MGANCIEHRCFSVQQIKQKNRCNSNDSSIEYWTADNDRNLSFNDIKTISGTKTPACNAHNYSNVYEDLACGQYSATDDSSCIGHRATKGSQISVKNEDFAISSGVGSFVSNLFNQINVELNSRKQHAIYSSLSAIVVPLQNNQLSTSDLNDALNIICEYYNVTSADIATKYDYSEVSATVDKQVATSSFIRLASKFNSEVINECICYSDCLQYKVCYCYGNCNHY